MERLDGKYVLVTGASSGIGQAIAVRFAQEGAHVAINYRSGAEQAEVTRAMVRDAYTATGRPDRRELVVQADVANEDRVKAMFTRVLAEFGRLDVLINNAGIQKVAASHEIEIADFDRVWNVDVRGSFLCSREAIRHFLSRPGGGVILNNSSVHETIPKPKYLPYSVSKGGLENMTRITGAGIRRPRHPRERGRAGRRGDANQQSMDRRSESAR